MPNPEVAELQPDQQHVIAALIEENRALNDSKIFLTAVVRQIKTEFDEYKQTVEAERASLGKAE